MTDVVAVGSVVTITDDSGRTGIWQIVRDGEGDMTQGRIAQSTRLARAILSHGIGGTGEVHGVDGERWWVRIEAATTPDDRGAGSLPAPAVSIR